MKNVAKPITKVIRPSIKNNHLCVHVNTSAGNSRYLQDKQGGEETYRQPRVRLHLSSVKFQMRGNSR